VVLSRKIKNKIKIKIKTRGWRVERRDILHIYKGTLLRTAHFLLRAAPIRHDISNQPT
jgi:hypothetical protein